MQLLLEELSQVLQEEYRHFERLFSLTHSEQQCLVANDTTSLDHSLVELREVVARMESLSQRRSAILCRISEQTGIAPVDLTLKRLSELGRGPVGMRLERMKAEFDNMLGLLRRSNGQNLLLIRNSLDMTDRAVRLILGETGRVQFYGGAGEAQNGTSGPRVLSRRI